MRYPQIKFGNFTSDGNDKTIDLGFIPDYILVRNVTKAIQLELFKSELTTKGFKSTAASTYHTFLSSGGLELVDTITIDPGTENDDSDPVRVTKVQGFLIPTAVLDNNDVVHWMAIRES